MAKKKSVIPEEELEEDLDDLEDDFSDEEDDFESDLSEISDKQKKEDVPGSLDEDLEIEEEDVYEVEEEPRFKDYKYLDLRLVKALRENDYELSVEGQSHGFCNMFVKHLLKTEGVIAAAYKVTGIEAPQIFIRLVEDDKYKINDILYGAIESLRGEVLEAQNMFKKLG
ncbi:MAG: RpoL/Rpb11 RNA polymerase subunit family protein [Promethearchaeota archaeon]|jgi:DNA-directed RNA polymerase subunit L